MTNLTQAINSDSDPSNIHILSDGAEKGKLESRKVSNLKEWVKKNPFCSAAIICAIVGPILLIIATQVEGMDKEAKLGVLVPGIVLTVGGGLYLWVKACNKILVGDEAEAWGKKWLEDYPKSESNISED